MKPRLDYANKKAELDAILNWFENENTDIEKALAKYQAAESIIKELEDYLHDTKAQIDLIVKNNTQS